MFRQVLVGRLRRAAASAAGSRSSGATSSRRPVAAPRRPLAESPPDAFDMVVVDEFHHAAGRRRYRRLLDHLRPKILLGPHRDPRARSTARTSPAGSTAGSRPSCGSGTPSSRTCSARSTTSASATTALDFRDRAGAGRPYDVAALDDVYTGDDVEHELVVSQVRDKVTDARRMRALGFASARSRTPGSSPPASPGRHPAPVALGGHPEARTRSTALRDLRDRRDPGALHRRPVQRGPRRPAVDTVLFLRPTESVTVFLQQLGRGLRRDDGEGRADRAGLRRAASTSEFRFDLRFRALTGRARASSSTQQVEDGFPFLPSGLLHHARSGGPRASWTTSGPTPATTGSRRRRAAPRDGCGRSPLPASPTTWTRGAETSPTSPHRPVLDGVCRAAGYAPSPPATADEEPALWRRVRALAHVDDAARRLGTCACSPVASPTCGPS